MQFNHAYTYTVCSPSRSCILTGRFGYRTGVGHVVSAASNNFLQSPEFTLPRAFAANSSLNFQLKHIGKWHLTAISGTNAELGPCVIGGWPSFTGSLAGGFGLPLAFMAYFPAVVLLGRTGELQVNPLFAYAAPLRGSPDKTD